MAKTSMNLDLQIGPELPERRDFRIGVLGSGFIVSDCHLVAYRKAGFNPVGIASRNIENARLSARACLIFSRWAGVKSQSDIRAGKTIVKGSPLRRSFTYKSTAESVTGVFMLVGMFSFDRLRLESLIDRDCALVSFVRPLIHQITLTGYSLNSESLLTICQPSCLAWTINIRSKGSW